MPDRLNLDSVREAADRAERAIDRLDLGDDDRLEPNHYAQGVEDVCHWIAGADPTPQLQALFDAGELSWLDGETILSHEDSNISARLAVLQSDRGDDNAWLLGWTDGVANDWREVYPDKGTALVRFGLLLSASADDDLVEPRCFQQQNAEEFIPAWGAHENLFLTPAERREADDHEPGLPLKSVADDGTATAVCTGCRQPIRYLNVDPPGTPKFVWVTDDDDGDAACHGLKDEPLRHHPDVVR